MKKYTQNLTKIAKYKIVLAATMMTIEEDGGELIEYEYSPKYKDGYIKAVLPYISLAGDKMQVFIKSLTLADIVKACPADEDSIILFIQINNLWIDYMEA